MTLTAFLFMDAPISHIRSAKTLASSKVFINAPFPTFTSNTMQSLPAAIFLLIILDAISGILSTVAV